MKLSRFAYKIAGFTLLASGLFGNSANASTGLCKKPVPTCGSKCGQAPSPGSTGAPCTVTVSESGGTTTVNQQDPICVDPQTEIEWVTAEPNSKFVVKFTDNPFCPPTRKFKGDATHPKRRAAIKEGCYQFTAQHSILHQPTPSPLDPKVIVNGPNLRQTDGCPSKK